MYENMVKITELNEMVEKTMDNSAKLNELFKLFCEKCGYDIVNEKLLLSDKYVNKQIEQSSKYQNTPLNTVLQMQCEPWMILGIFTHCA